LQPEPAIAIEADGGVRAVDLLLDHKMAAGDLAETGGVQILVTRLRARIEEMAGPRIFSDRIHPRSIPATATM
jgi:hypothetical protein